ncbi:MAG: hypothetical protein ACLQBY_13955 [Solirubrobacteraceae bacterium]
MEAIAMKNTQLAEALAARGDRFSQLMSKLVRDEYVGDQLHSRSGLSDEEHAELRSLSNGAHASFCQEMVEATSRLRALLSQGDPLYTLSIIRASNMVTGWGTYYEPTHHGLESKVELVAGLLLTQPPPAETEPVSAKTMQSIHDELDRLLELSLLRNLTAPRNENIVVAELKLMSTVNWMTTRGTSYAHHGTDLATALYRPFERWCLERYGFTIDDMLNIGETAQALLTGRMNALLDEARAFAERVQTHASSPAAREKLTAEESAKLAAPETLVSLTQRAAIYVYEHGVRDAMSFTLDDLIDAGLPQDRVDAVLKELSLSAGSLGPDAYGGLFDESPLVEHPFLEFDGRFVLVVPGMVLRDAVVLLEDRFMRGVSTFSKARAKTLDRLALGYLKALLPDSKGFTNLHYDGTELDGLVIFENTAFVVEGKGSALSIQAQRGDVVRLGRDLGRAVEDAWTQGARARDYLLRDEAAVFVDEGGSEVLRIPAGTIAEVFIVNPTLHELAGHASQLPRLRSLGLFPAGEFPWSVFINDLRVISETADNAAVFLHYLTWRARLPLGERVTVMDELDLWGSYLLCERFGSLAGEGHHIVGNSITDFDAYYAGVVGDGPKRPKPRKFLEEPITGFVERMARERPPGWRDAAGVCLDLSLPELAFVVREARRMWKRANASKAPDITDCGRVRLIGVPRGHHLAEVIAATEQLESETTFHIYVRGSKAKRGEIAWAKCVKPITFELSDFEEAAFRALARAEMDSGAGHSEP